MVKEVCFTPVSWAGRLAIVELVAAINGEAGGAVSARCNFSIPLVPYCGRSTRSTPKYLLSES